MAEKIGEFGYDAAGNPKIKLADKRTALVDLGRHFALYRVEIGTSGAPPPAVPTLARGGHTGAGEPLWLTCLEHGARRCYLRVCAKASHRCRPRRSVKGTSPKMLISIAFALCPHIANVAATFG